MPDFTKIDFSKQDEDGYTLGVRTRGGDRVRLLCVDDRADDLIVGRIDNFSGKVASWTRDGASDWGVASLHDLVATPRKGKAWVNVYLYDDNSVRYSHPLETRSKADQAEAETRYATRAACIEVEWKEGQGI